MTTVRLVALREIRQRLRGRVFRIATLLILVGVAAAIVIPTVAKGKSHPQHVGVIDTPTQTIVATAGRVGTKVRIAPEANTGAARAALRSGDIDIVVINSDQILVKKAIGDDDGSDTADLAHGLAQTLGLRQAMVNAKLSTAQALGVAEAKAVPINSLEPGKSNSKSSQTGTAVVGLVVLFIMLTQYLTWTLIGVMEEKSSRVVEVLLAAVRPLQLLTGKVIGIGAVVFVQAAIVAVFALLVGRAVGSDLLHGKAPLVLVAALVWLVLGYAFYCWLYAAAGSMAERQDQVQSLAIPLSLPLIVGYIIGITAASSATPHLYVKVLAYLPPTAPFEMTALVGLGAVAWWQFLLSAAISVASTVVVARVAGTVYRRAILRTGRRVRLREILA